MLPRFRHICLLIGITIQACGLAGCGTINERVAAGISDTIPAWAGGLPADAPPRPGTAKYDEFMRERERKRLLPASERDQLPKGDEAKPLFKQAAAEFAALAAFQPKTEGKVELLRRSAEARALLQRLQGDAQTLAALPRVQLPTEFSEKLQASLPKRSVKVAEFSPRTAR